MKEIIENRLEELPQEVLSTVELSDYMADIIGVCEEQNICHTCILDVVCTEILQLQTKQKCNRK